MFLTARSSTAMPSNLRTRSVEVLCRKSLRASATFAWCRATFRLALARFFEPRCFLARIRWYRFNRFSYRSMCLGCGIRSPVDSTRKSVRPRSTPTLLPVVGSGAGSGTSACRVTNHRPAGSRDTVTVVGSRVARVDVRPRPHDPQRCRGFRESQFALAPPERRPGVGRGLLYPAGFEPGEPGALPEEGLERGVLVPQGLLQRDRGNLVQPPVFGCFLQRGQRGVGVLVGRRLVFGGVAGLPGGQGAVPDDADAPECAVQHRRLFGVRVGPNLATPP